MGLSDTITPSQSESESNGNEGVLLEYKSGHALCRMKILFHVVFAGSQQVKSKCRNPRWFHKKEQGENKQKNWINVV